MSAPLDMEFSYNPGGFDVLEVLGDRVDSLGDLGDRVAS